MSATAPRHQFTEDEIRLRVGCRVRARIALPLIPKGTSGKVIAFIPAGRNFEAIVEWDLMPDPFGRRRRRGYTQEEYEQLLEEVGE